VHRQPDEQVSGTAVFAILHREKTNKVFGSALRATALKSSTTVRLPKAASARRLRRRQVRGIVGGATSWRIRHQLLRALPPPLIDDLNLTSSFTSASPPPATTTTIGRYNPRDLMSSFILSNLSGVRARLTPVIVFMLCNMLFCHASIQYMLNLVHQFIMIYILVLI
jgi:hypothetical protein